MLNDSEENIHLKLEREQRVDDALLMRKHDEALEVMKFIPDNIMETINYHFQSYLQQFPYPLEFLAVQTLQDWRAYLIPLVNDYRKIDLSKPVAIIKKTGKKIFVNHTALRDDLKKGESIYFLLEEFVGGK